MALNDATLDAYVSIKIACYSNDYICSQWICTSLEVNGAIDTFLSFYRGYAVQ